jgi:hypothetical protein
MSFSPVKALRRLLARWYARNAMKREHQQEVEMRLSMQKALNGMVTIQENDAAFREALRRIKIATLRRSVLEEYTSLVRGEPTLNAEAAEPKQQGQGA